MGLLSLVVDFVLEDLAIFLLDPSAGVAGSSAGRFVRGVTGLRSSEDLAREMAR